MSTKHKLLAALITCLALGALGVSGYLTYVTWNQSTVAGCGGGEVVDCDAVLQSPWSKWLGLPVSLFGALAYMAILAVVWPATLSGNRLLLGGLLTLAFLAAGAGLWFIGLQVLVLHHFCLYCLAVHTCGIVVAMLTLLLVLGGESADNVDHMRALLGVFAEPVAAVRKTVGIRELLAALGLAAFGLAGLVAGQVFFAPATMEIIEVQPVPQNAVEETVHAEVAENDTSEPASTPSVSQDEPTDSSPPVDPRRQIVQRIIRLPSMKDEVDLSQVPVLGNPAAEHILIEMLDYTCPHCRELHPYIQKALTRYGDQLGIVIFHIPLSRKCNPIVLIDQASHAKGCDYARLACGVWKLSPGHFAEYHDWLMEGEKGPAAHVARNKALKLVGEQILLNKSIEVEANRLIAKHSEEVNRLQTGLPVLVFERGIIKGKPESEESWYKLLEERVGLKPPGESGADH